MTNQLPVTLVTANAGRAEDDAAFMRELLSLRDDLAKQLRKKPTLPQMLERLGEPLSRKAFWAHRLAEPPTRTTFPPDARDIIRKAVGEAPLPAVTEVTANLISPSAAMYWIGPDTGEKSGVVLMIAPTLSHAEISVNGTVRAYTVPQTPETPVTPVIFGVAPTRDARPPRYRPSLSLELKARIEASGRTVEELITIGLEATR